MWCQLLGKANNQRIEKELLNGFNEDFERPNQLPTEKKTLKPFVTKRKKPSKSRFFTPSTGGHNFIKRNHKQHLFLKYANIK